MCNLGRASVLSTGCPVEPSARSFFFCDCPPRALCRPPGARHHHFHLYTETSRSRGQQQPPPRLPQFPSPFIPSIHRPSPSADRALPAMAAACKYVVRQVSELPFAFLTCRPYGFSYDLIDLANLDPVETFMFW